MRISARMGVVAAVMMASAIGPAGAGRAQVVRPLPPPGPAEQVGEVVGGALDTAGRAVDSAGRAVERGLRNAFARTRGAVESMEVTARVYSRLHWDRELAGSRLTVEARPGGLVVLRGVVPSPEAADRAVALSVSTIGVSRVVSELVAPEAAGSAGTPAPTVTPGRAATPDLEPLDRPAPGPIPRLEPLPEPEPTPDPAPIPAPGPRPQPVPQPDPAVEPVPAPTIRPPLP